MTPSRPYILRAIYEWLLDNHLTPYIMVDATHAQTKVPKKFVEEGKIVLNISPTAVSKLILSNDSVEFSASFAGIPEDIYVPVTAVKAIYAFENGRGMVFSDEDNGGDDGGSASTNTQQSNQKKTKKPPKLKIVK